MDPEFQRVMLRVLAIGGLIAAIGGAGVFFIFRSFGETPANVRSRTPLQLIVIGFVIACCLVLLRMSFLK